MRFIAGIKLEQAKAILDLSKRADKKFDVVAAHGFTYLDEIIIIMEQVLESTNETATEKAIVRNFDDLRMKY